MAAMSGASDTPLRRPDWAKLREDSIGFAAIHPKFNVREAFYEQRLVTPKLKAAYSILTMKQENEIITKLGASDCDRCGKWTCAWCESCDFYKRSPKSPICSSCDETHLVCDLCMSQDRLWQSTDQDESEYMIINGFHAEDGTFTTFKKPLKLKLTSIPKGHDGVFNMQFIMQKVAEHAVQEDRKQSSSSH